MAEQLRKVVRGKADAPFRQIETEFVTHRPAQPGIDAGRRRPHRFDQPAEDDAVGFRQARFQLAEDVELSARQFAPPHQAIGEGCLEHLGIVVPFDHQAGLLRPVKQIAEGGGEREPVLTFEGGGDAMFIQGKILQGLAMALREFGKIMRPGTGEAFERRQRLAQRRDQRPGPIEVAIPEPGARFGAVKRGSFLVVQLA